MIKLFGALVDTAGRCVHYHSNLDVVALKCAQCQRYYACYQCHDAAEDHHFKAMAKTDPAPVLCGNCGHTLTFTQYHQGHCAYCQHAFNPKCSLHEGIYFN
ncbi:hypothetical protein FC83_GL002327 [Agrilactobacillus composti DSM 18527 = JCM 14202]|uniref:CHY-type domain-containing protein n=1 Tax=Agrilactobacillus composti DSM 18527 = JCM 14202 TaxID=1423734 RepID=X0PGE9_9LACO|nr:hypothetical protein FC83_GL002327 [Agrilactobacillus composti DSM 18527 = JCM 14202]GAF40958.1 hypothetical protein JCM14202_2872 [Agrilactobacillus composti DSM 18527 = JCM 14202]